MLPIPKSILLATLVLLSFGASAHAQTVIDNFNKNQAAVSQTGAGTASSTQADSMVGGERDLKVTVAGGGYTLR